MYLAGRHLRAFVPRYCVDPAPSLKGIDLFHCAHFFDANEVLMDVWRAGRGERRNFYRD